MSDERDLADVRGDIDAIDARIQELLAERARCAQRVAEIKLDEVQEARERGEHDREVEFYRPEREAQVLRRIMDRDGGPLEGPTVAHIFREIMSACLALERPLQVAYLGPEGTFTQAAALKHFGHAAICIPQVTIDTVFAEVESGNCNYGIVPVENSTEGMVSHTLDSFLDSPLQISGEVEMRISHHLLVAPGTKPEDVTRICAHQQALAQCRNWLDTHWPRVEREAVSSNGEAARIAAAGDGVAAVAGDMAAEAYQLERLAEHIEDAPDNTTRFLVVGRSEVPPSGRDKTSIVVFQRADRPGSLLAILQEFAARSINLTKLESRPTRQGLGDYCFLLDLEGHISDELVADCLKNLRAKQASVKFLGSYPAAGDHESTRAETSAAFVDAEAWLDSLRAQQLDS